MKLLATLLSLCALLTGASAAPSAFPTNYIDAKFVARDNSPWGQAPANGEPNVPAWTYMSYNQTLCSNPSYFRNDDTAYGISLVDVSWVAANIQRTPGYWKVPNHGKVAVRIELNNTVSLFLNRIDQWPEPGLVGNGDLGEYLYNWMLQNSVPGQMAVGNLMQGGGGNMLCQGSPFIAAMQWQILETATFDLVSSV